MIYLNYLVHIIVVCNNGDGKMDKNDLFLKIYGSTGVLGVFCELFTSIQISYTILLILIIIDTITGICTAIKYKRFSSTGLRKAAKKIITYTLCILTVQLLETILRPLFTATMLSQLIIAYLAITESFSIMENLTLLGAPIPSNILPILITTLKIPAISSPIVDTTKVNIDNFSNIDDMIDYQIPAFEDKYIRYFLEIKCGGK